jgi:hypothetical protein
MRLWDTKIELLREESIDKHNKNSEQNAELEEKIIDSSEEANIAEVEEVQEVYTESNTFEIPNNIKDIKILKAILEKYPWDIEIKVGNVTKMISPEWLTQLKSLL